MRRLTIRRRTALFAALILLVLAYVALVLLSSRSIKPLRLDLTADGLYTLAPGTEQIVDGIHRPIRLTLYFSEHATRDLPQLRSYEQRVNEMLQEMVARSHGRIHLQVVDPVPYSDDEASAESSGLTAISGGSNGERVFFGLEGAAPSVGADGSQESVSNIDQRNAAVTLPIPLFDPSREAFLEYDIAKLLYELNEPDKPDIGVISSLPALGNPVLGDPPWTVMRQLQQLFDVKTLDVDTLKHIDGSIKVVLLIHPKALSLDAQYALDQYVLSGGHLIVFVDPFAESDNAPFVNNETGVTDSHYSNLSRLFTTWGVAYDPTQIVLDRASALPIELAGVNLAHPAMLGLSAQEINHDDVVTSSLQRVNVASAGHFDLVPNTTSRLIPLLQSSGDALTVPAQRVVDASSNPSMLLQDYRPSGTRYVIAARLRGTFASAFPERVAQPGHLARSKPDSEVILVADTDVLTDRLWVDTQTFLGQPMLSAFADNGDFVTNLADNLSGSSALLSIRGRSTSQRPFTRVLALQHAADRKFLQKKQELEHELADTMQRLDELQPTKGSRDNTTSAAQKHEIEQFLQRKLEISKELRDVQHQLNAQIDALGARIKWINIVLIPALIALFGLVYGWRRTRRSRRRGRV
jgi:ABC-type uncharacterized transport system involved in gliding motility auxiliary subunit